MLYFSSPSLKRKKKGMLMRVWCSADKSNEMIFIGSIGLDKKWFSAKIEIEQI